MSSYFPNLTLPQCCSVEFFSFLRLYSASTCLWPLTYCVFEVNKFFITHVDKGPVKYEYWLCNLMIKTGALKAATLNEMNKSKYVQASEAINRSSALWNEAHMFLLTGMTETCRGGHDSPSRHWAALFAFVVHKFQTDLNAEHAHTSTPLHWILFLYRKMWMCPKCFLMSFVIKKRDICLSLSIIGESTHTDKDIMLINKDLFLFI